MVASPFPLWVSESFGTRNMAGWSALYVTRLRRPPMHSPELSPGSRPFTAGLSFRLSKQWISRVP